MLRIIHTVESSDSLDELIVLFENAQFTIHIPFQHQCSGSFKDATIKKNGETVAKIRICSGDLPTSQCVNYDIISVKMHNFYVGTYSIIVFNAKTYEIRYIDLPSDTYAIDEEGTIFVRAINEKEIHKNTNDKEWVFSSCCQRVPHIIYSDTDDRRLIRNHLEMEEICGKLVFVSEFTGDTRKVYRMWKLNGELVDCHLSDIYSSPFYNIKTNRSKEKRYFCPDGSHYFISPSNELMTCTPEDSIVIPVELNDEEEKIIFKDSRIISIIYVRKCSSSLTICLRRPDIKKGISTLFVLHYSVNRTKKVTK